MNANRLVDAIVKSNLGRNKTVIKNDEPKTTGTYSREEMVSVFEEIISGFDEMQRGTASMGKVLWHVDRLSLGVKSAKEIVTSFWEEEIGRESKERDWKARYLKQLINRGYSRKEAYDTLMAMDIIPYNDDPVDCANEESSNYGD